MRPTKHLEFESLEERLVLSGTVTVGFQTAPDGAGALVLTGDAASNQVTVTQLSTGQFQIQGEAGTQIVVQGGGLTPIGTTGAITTLPSNFAGDLVFNMGAGSDDVTLFNVTVPDDLSVNGGSEDDKFTMIGGSVENATGGGSLNGAVVDLGTGNNSATLVGVDVGGRLVMFGQAGNDTLFALGGSVDGTTTVDLGDGNDKIIALGARHFNNTLFQLGNGDNTVLLGGRIFGSLTVGGGPGFNVGIGLGLFVAGGTTVTDFDIDLL